MKMGKTLWMERGNFSEYFMHSIALTFFLMKIDLELETCSSIRKRARNNLSTLNHQRQQ